MGNISTYANLSTGALSLQNLILVTPQKNLGYQPQNGPITDTSATSQTQLDPTILFHYEGEQTMSLKSDITDHYVEDNSTIQDQIALKPEIVTTHGFIGELNDVVPPALAAAKAALTKLTVLNGYLPQLTIAAQIAYNTAAQAYQIGANTLQAGVAAWSSLTGIGSSVQQTQQQIYFSKFYGYWQERTLFTVQTPWAIFYNMAIENLRAIQDAETRMITDFELSFKRIRFANVQTVALNSIKPGNAQGRTATQAATVVNLGTSSPPLAPVSFLSQVQGAVA